MNEIDLKIGQELTFKELNKCMVELTQNEVLKDYNLNKLLYKESVTYAFNDNCLIYVRFKVLEENKEDLLETKIKIEYINLIYLKKGKWHIFKGED